MKINSCARRRLGSWKSQDDRTVGSL